MCAFGRFGYINWMWYGWGALMINQYEHSSLQLYGTPILEYYSLNGIDKYAFIGYCSLTFVFFFLVAYLVRLPGRPGRPPPCLLPGAWPSPTWETPSLLLKTLCMSTLVLFFFIVAYLVRTPGACLSAAPLEWCPAVGLPASFCA